MLWFQEKGPGLFKWNELSLPPKLSAETGSHNCPGEISVWPFRVQVWQENHRSLENKKKKNTHCENEKKEK